MNKRITLIRRKSDLSAAEFRQHWSGSHAEIARHLPGLLRYNQNHVVRSSVSESDTAWPVHGFVELWFRDERAIIEAASSETTRKLIEDEPRFLSCLTGLIMEGGGQYNEAPYKLFAINRTATPSSVHESDILNDITKPTFAELARTSTVMKREGLASESCPPEFVFVAGFPSMVAATRAFDIGSKAFKGGALEFYLTEELRVV